MSIHQIFCAYWTSATAIAAVRLGLFERLSLGPASAEEVARALRLHPDGARRLLTALASLGLVQSDGMRFANGPMADLFLVSGRPAYVGGTAHHHAAQLWPVWSHLETAVREGRSVQKEAFGSEEDPFTTLLQTPESARLWLEGMHGSAAGLADALLYAHDFRPHSRVADVGGGACTVALHLKRVQPHLHISVLEREEVARLLPRWLAERGVAGQVAVHTGDFFRPETFPRPLDAALLCRVLHDWSDEKSLAILRACQAALSPGGAVLVTESLLEPAAVPDRFSALSNLMMLALTGGGRERTGQEYEALMRQAGFRVLGTVRLGGLGVIKGTKA